MSIKIFDSSFNLLSKISYFPDVSDKADLIKLRSLASPISPSNTELVFSNKPGGGVESLITSKLLPVVRGGVCFVFPIVSIW